MPHATVDPCSPSAREPRGSGQEPWPPTSLRCERRDRGAKRAFKLRDLRGDEDHERAPAPVAASGILGQVQTNHPGRTSPPQPPQQETSRIISAGLCDDAVKSAMDPTRPNDPADPFPARSTFSTAYFP